MMAMAHPKLALRPFLPTDTAMLREIFRDSIADLTDEDYTPAQQEAWASVADDEAAFGKNGDNKTDGSLMSIWEKSIKPTLYDFGGEVLVCEFRRKEP